MTEQEHQQKAWEYLVNRLEELKAYKGTWSQLEPVIGIIDEAWENTEEK